MRIQITTERLLLEPISFEYTDEIFREFSGDVTRYTHAIQGTIGDTQNFIQTSIERFADGTDLTVVITDKNTGEFIGCAGIHGIHTPTPEFGIWIKKSAQGNRYGVEIITGLKQWADEHVQYTYIKYPVDKENVPSRKIPEFFGGVIADEYDKEAMGGRVLHLLEYRIYPDKK